LTWRESTRPEVCSVEVLTAGACLDGDGLAAADGEREVEVEGLADGEGDAGALVGPKPAR
jgi:hypothetical protein